MRDPHIDGLYWDFHWPLSLKRLLDEQKKHRPDAGVVKIKSGPTVREWFSQPRPSGDDTVEVLSINLRQPLPISEIGFEVKRVPVRIECWYQDKSSNWRRMVDHNHVPIGLTLSSTDAADSWYKFSADIHQVIARAVQLRCVRVHKPALGTDAYSVGLRKTLLRRNIYRRDDARLPIEDRVDEIGNVISHYVKDWEASRAIDDRPSTFWRSAPQPDHQAVVSLFLDLRTAEGSPQHIDALYIDPVHTGQTLNIYWSNDETAGTRKLSPIALMPSRQENVDWKPQLGLRDLSSDTTNSRFAFPFTVGPLVSQDVWIGMDWTPTFDPVHGPPKNAVLFEVDPKDPDPAQWWPTITYDVSAAELVLSFTNNDDDYLQYRAALSPLFRQDRRLKIAVGWKYNPRTVLLSVWDQSNTELARLEVPAPDLPSLIAMSGTVGFRDFRGIFASHVVKLQDYTGAAARYQRNPEVYVAQDRLAPDSDGQLPPGTLDNAIYAADWTIQAYGTGGVHDSVYESKVWNPVWRDFLTEKGKLVFPQTVSARYLKLEFTNLSEESYPIYDVGIKTLYKVFPVEVKQMARVKHPGIVGTAGGLLQLGGELALGAVGIGSVNWLDPGSVLKAVNSIFGQTLSPVQVTSGTPMVFSELPASLTSTDRPEASGTTELANPYVYRRSPPSADRLAGHTLNALGKDWAQTIAQGSADIAATIDDAFTPLVDYFANPTALPVQGKDWWMFPGGLKALPAAVMNGLTAATETVVGRKPTTETRVRFVTASVHRYDIKTVTRDAHMAYFAGLREVRALATTHIADEDPEVFKFSTYSPDKWVFSQRARRLDSGPVTTSGKIHTIENSGFDLDLQHWDFDSAEWERDPTMGRWHPGSLKIAADGAEKNARSTVLYVDEDDTVTFSCWVHWTNLHARDGMAAIVLGGTTYAKTDSGADSGDSGGESSDSDDVFERRYAPIADVVFDEVTYADWSVHVDSVSDEDGWVRLQGTWSAPAGVDAVRVRLSVTEDATAGQIRFDTVGIVTTQGAVATLYKDFTTTTTFNRVKFDFNDSGVVRSDSMWERADPLATNIDNLKLAYYTNVKPLPSQLDPTEATGATWEDTSVFWADKDAVWGAPEGLVRISIDPNRIFDDRRVIKFSRNGDSYGEGGLTVIQQTNFVPNALVRPCIVYYKPRYNTNQMKLRIRKLSTNELLHEEAFEPKVGQWAVFSGEFTEIIDAGDLIYKLEGVSSGDDEDEVYVSDLFCELTHVRYFVRFGGPGAFLHDVTPAVYDTRSQVHDVVSTEPVNDVSVRVAILTPKGFAYSGSITPTYNR